ncbi:methyltransferase domain-containing protein [Kutzneria sp. NPDC052558]|uniref:methyltransferase domain-containing protein n=1 Tax=Kutzneria sp. NPDC052558 TaxID=3364121 RepID=UPI0037C6CBD7
MTQGWPARAAALVEELRAKGALRTEDWAEPLSTVPRHHLVPCFYEQDRNGRWERVDSSHGDRWWNAVYSNTALVTALGDAAMEPISSSSQPSLMVRMLEALDVRPGDRVLEIGTGTGYNAALLAARLGDANVYSIDVNADLVALARERLASIGREPTLRVVDGEEGLPEFAPYDRVIATCSVPEVPWAWADQLVPGGLALVDVKRGSQSGNLVLLRRMAEKLEGRFLPEWAAFMPMRHEGRPTPLPAGSVDTTAAESVTELGAQPWTKKVPWFLAQLASAQPMTFGYVLDATGGAPSHARLTAPDGSWCTVALDAVEGAHVVRQAGPLRLWDAVEAGYSQWAAFDRPAWDRLGLTVRRDRQWVWVDDPANPIVRGDVEGERAASTVRR